jgi:hypothetical protein
MNMDRGAFTNHREPRMSRFRTLVKLPFGLLGMLALVAVVERGVERGAPRFMTWIEMDWRIVGREATTKAIDAEVLILGDSMLKFGVAPRVLEEKLGRSVYSLALLDGKPAASYFLLRRALNAGARPKVVLVDYQPECLREPPDELMQNRHWKGLLTLGECWDAFLVYRDADFLARTSLARLLPSYRCRIGLKDDLLSALRGKGNANIEDNVRNDRNRRLNRGGLLLAKKPSFHGALPAKFSRHMFTDDWFSRREHTEYVRRFLSLAQRHRITVVWVLPPTTPELERMRESHGMHARYTRFALRFQSLYTNLYVFDGRHSGYNEHLFVDPVHLDRDGATALSASIAAVLPPLIEGRTPESRWATLAAPVRLEAPPALEDMDQSLRIVTEIFSAVRR